MHHIDKDLNQAMRQPCENFTSAPLTKHDDKVITRLFAVLGVLYGSRWTSLIQNDESESAARIVWGKALAGVDPVLIKMAIDRLPIDLPNWPPTVGQFIQIMKCGTDPTMVPTLPKPRGDEKIALAALTEAYDIIRRQSEKRD